ncbi:glycosyltransferase family 2 protein [Leptolyngbya sp. KIOST-1]|uniref:glycosyltransferase family 2 protein n=1 Tax=Leptolyngbya sp. KIOST-1 TaxID=1229172 RepID=UPI000569901F|nr:glycosyltransferase family 2 protein [Leptolyngbya sp. KIOST-1]
MKTTVLVPTYRRPQDLQRCLEALQNQQRLPDEVLIVLRATDQPTWNLLEQNTFSPLTIRTQIVEQPGQVAALNAGLDAASGDIIAITDDDAAPHPDWLKRIEAHFLADAQVGGVGGRDWVYMGGTLHGPTADQVVPRPIGQIQWFGRVVGNHHLGTDKPQEVAILKGANMSYRCTAIGSARFDPRLQGTGAQVHNDLGFSLAIKRQGWKLIYDPAIAVDHFPAQRFDKDRRDAFSYGATLDAAHNETLILMNYFAPFRRAIYLGWSILIGTRVKPGIVQLCRLLPREGLQSWQKGKAVLQGRWQGCRTWLGRTKKLT